MENDSNKRNGLTSVDVVRSLTIALGILSENIDCFGNTINCGDEVMYRIPKRPLYVGVIKEIVSPGIYKLESGEVVKYVSVYKLKRDI